MCVRRLDNSFAAHAAGIIGRHSSDDTGLSQPRHGPVLSGEQVPSGCLGRPTAETEDRSAISAYAAIVITPTVGAHPDPRIRAQAATAWRGQ